MYDAVSDFPPPAPLGHKPEYASNDGPTEHSVSLNTDGGHPNMTLRIVSMSPQGSLPVFVGDSSAIRGHVDVDLSEPLSAESITVSLRAKIVATALYEKQILKIDEIVWKAGSGGKAPEHKSLLDNVLHDHPKEHLQGRQSWPFTLSLPTTITFDEHEAKELDIGVTPGAHYALPPTHREKDWSTDIDYEVVATIKCSEILAHDKILQTQIGYVTPTVSPSLPDSEKVEWNTFSDLTLGGTVNKHEKIDLKCAISVPSLPSYKRGTTIPLILNVSSDDTRVLESFSQPDSLIVQLVKNPKFHSRVLTTGFVTNDNVKFYPSVAKATMTGPAGEKTEGGANERTFRGEIHIPESLSPSFSLGHLELKYFLEILPHDATGFEPATEENHCRTPELTITAF